MSKEIENPVVEAPQVISAEELKATQNGAKGWSKGQEAQEKAVILVGEILNAKTTLPQYNEMQAQWALTYTDENPEASKEKVSQQRSRFFKSALKYAGIKKPVAQTDGAEAKKDNRTTRADKIQKLENLGMEELGKRLQASKNAIGNATTKKAGKEASAKMHDVLEAIDNIKKKKEEKFAEAKKADLSEVRELLKEATHEKIKAVLKVLKGGK